MPKKNINNVNGVRTVHFGEYLSAQVTTEQSGGALFQLDMTHSTLILSLKGECSNL